MVGALLASYQYLFWSQSPSLQGVSFLDALGLTNPYIDTCRATLLFELFTPYLLCVTSCNTLTRVPFGPSGPIAACLLQLSVITILVSASAWLEYLQYGELEAIFGIFEPTIPQVNLTLTPIASSRGMLIVDSLDC